MYGSPCWIWKYFRGKPVYPQNFLSVRPKLHVWMQSIVLLTRLEVPTNNVFMDNKQNDVNDY